jgi:predicted alpha-1,6-mannanase (GH76 family)
MSFDAGPALKALQTWYNAGLYGLYHWDDPSIPAWVGTVGNLIADIVERYQETERWWNSANAIGALIDYMATTGDMTYSSVLDNTFTKAQTAFTVVVTSQINLPGGKSIATGISKLTYTNFLDKYYDDEGWWALTWIKAFDLTKEQKFLDMAVTIFQDMAGGWDDTFGGGIYWGKDHSGSTGSPYKNAIANELFMAVAARLYLRNAGGAPVFPGTNQASYKTWAVNAAAWFINSGLIRTATTPGSGAPYLINDSLNPSTGKNDGTQAFWSYNHGVILRALSDLSIILAGQPDALPQATDPLALAESIAGAAMTYFAPTGIMSEPACGSSCSVDNCMFKGVFIRDLAVLYAHDLKPAYGTLITANAGSVLQNANSSSQFGCNWSQPPDTVDFVRQATGIDAVNAANRVQLADGPISLRKTLALAGFAAPTSLRKAIAPLTPSVRGWTLAWTT